MTFSYLQAHRQLLFMPLLLVHIYSFGQEGPGHSFSDPKTGCRVWLRHDAQEDSITWNGPCKDGMANGKGTLKGFHDGSPVTTYQGHMRNGRFHGQGKYLLPNNMKLEGNFSEGEFLDLEPACLAASLKKEVVLSNDTMNYYVNDNGAHDLYYHILVPEATIRGVIVLLPGTWESTAHVLSSNKRLCKLAYEKGLVVMVASINQRLVMNDRVLEILNTIFSHAIEKYKLPRYKFVIGGFSMGGLFSMRYAELAFSDSSKTVIRPKAIFSVDGPVDLEHLYNNFKKKYNGNQHGEPWYGMQEMETYLGGAPDSIRSAYIRNSAFSISEKDGGNIRFLSALPIRIYNDVDPNWWMDSRGVDMYDMNALDQSAAILLLFKMGNTRAQFINAYHKGYRIEGNRHPHSWSIVDPDECIKWIFEVLPN